MIISNNNRNWKAKKPRYRDARRALVERGLLLDNDVKLGLDHSGGMRKKYKLIVDSGDGESVDVVIRDSGLEIFKRVVARNSDYVNSVETSLSMGMSKRSRKRLIKKTYLLEAKKYRPSHMLGLTIPPEKWEVLNNDYERFSYFMRAKRYFLQRLRKKLNSSFSFYGALWFMEFQRRGAPHFHILMDIGKLSRKDWDYWLKWFMKTWGKALRLKNTPNVAVDFGQMKKKDFRYSRAYASKMEQKNAPFLASWGKWWSCMGEWNRVKDRVINSFVLSFEKLKLLIKGITENKKVKSCIESFIKGRCNSVWLTWCVMDKEKQENIKEKITYSCDKHQGKIRDVGLCNSS